MVGRSFKPGSFQLKSFSSRLGFDLINKSPQIDGCWPQSKSNFYSSKKYSGPFWDLTSQSFSAKTGALPLEPRELTNVHLFVFFPGKIG